MNIFKHDTLYLKVILIVQMHPCCMMYTTIICFIVQTSPSLGDGYFQLGIQFELH